SPSFRTPRAPTLFPTRRSSDLIRAHTEYIGLDTVQLHGDEGPEYLSALMPYVPAYKALRIGSSDDVAVADQFGGDRILVDAKVRSEEHTSELQSRENLG